MKEAMDACCLTQLYSLAKSDSQEGFSMRYVPGIGAIAGCMLAAACARGTETTLPAIDLSQTKQASALVVEGKPQQGFEGPDGVVKGHAAGAGLGAGVAVGALFLSSPATLIMAPIALPMLPAAVVVGAVKAHSVDDVDAAMTAFREVGQDEALLTSLDGRFLEALGEYGPWQWNCVAAVSMQTEAPCADRGPIARIEFLPVFAIWSDGNFNPDIHFVGEVTAIVTLESLEPGTPPVRLLEAKWAHRQELGPFFGLAEDGGALLRRRLETILDRFAVHIANDLYLAPRPQGLRKIKTTQYNPKHPNGSETLTRIEPPDWNYVRIHQTPIDTRPEAGSTFETMATPASPPPAPSPMVARVKAETYIEDNDAQFRTDLERYLRQQYCKPSCRWRRLSIQSHEVLQSDNAQVVVRVHYIYWYRQPRMKSRTFVLGWRGEKLVFLSDRKV